MLSQMHPSPELQMLSARATMVLVLLVPMEPCRPHTPISSVDTDLTGARLRKNDPQVSDLGVIS